MFTSHDRRRTIEKSLMPSRIFHGYDLLNTTKSYIPLIFMPCWIVYTFSSEAWNPVCCKINEFYCGHSATILFILYYMIHYRPSTVIQNVWKPKKLLGQKTVLRSENPCFIRSQTKLVWAACVSHFIKQSLQDSSIYLLKTVQTSFSTTETVKYIWHKYFFLFELMIKIFLSELFPESMIFWRSRAIKCLL